MSRRSREEALQQEKEAKSRRALKERAYQETQRSVYARIYQEQDAMPDDYEEAFQEEVSPPGRKGKRGRTVLITLLLMLLALVGAALAAHAILVHRPEIPAPAGGRTSTPSSWWDGTTRAAATPTPSWWGASTPRTGPWTC